MTHAAHIRTSFAAFIFGFALAVLFLAVLPAADARVPDNVNPDGGGGGGGGGGGIITASMTATPATVAPGGSSQLSWTSNNAESCTGTNFSTGGATSGSVFVTPAQTTVYSVNCDGKTASQTITVSAPAAPTATMTVSSASIQWGASSQISWSSTGATSCSGTNFATGGATSGNMSVSPTQTTTYTVSCTGSTGSASAYKTVTVTSSGSGAWTYIGYTTGKICTGGEPNHYLSTCPTTPSGQPGSCSNIGQTCRGTFDAQEAANMCESGGHVLYASDITYQCQSQMSCTVQSHTGVWYTGGTQQAVLVERANNALNCESLGSASYMFWNREVVDFNQGSGPDVYDPIQTTCYYIANPTGTQVKATTLNSTGEYSYSSGERNCGGGSLAVQCAAYPASSSVGDTVLWNATVNGSGSGTWQSSATYFTDYSCPLSPANIDKPHKQVPDCTSTSPAGASCSQSGTQCKVNTASGCGVETNIYTCQGGGGTPSCGPTEVEYNPSCVITAEKKTYTCPAGYAVQITQSYTCAPGGQGSNSNPYKEVASCVSCGGGGSASSGYLFTWTGTDSLQGFASSVEKAYETEGAKSAFVSVEAVSAGASGSSWQYAGYVPGKCFNSCPFNDLPVDGDVSCSTVGAECISCDGHTNGTYWTKSIFRCEPNSPSLVWQDGGSIRHKVCEGPESCLSIGATAGATCSTQGAKCLKTAINDSETCQSANYPTLYATSPVMNCVQGGSQVGNAMCMLTVASQCDDGIDNDGDGHTDATDPECTILVSDPGGSTGNDTEFPQCSDGKDNDNDGRVDGDDQQCTDPDDPSETSTPAATASLIANPLSVVSGNASTLTWSCANSTSASIQGIGTVTPTAGGTVSTGPLTATKGYQLTCTGTGAPTTAFATVAVVPPELTLTATPQFVKRGGSTVISWSAVSGATGCGIAGPGLALSHALSGSQTITNIQNAGTYTFTCSGGASKSVTVTIAPDFIEQ